MIPPLALLALLGCGPALAQETDPAVGTTEAAATAEPPTGQAPSGDAPLSSPSQPAPVVASPPTSSAGSPKQAAPSPAVAPTASGGPPKQSAAQHDVAMLEALLQMHSADAQVQIRGLRALGAIPDDRVSGSLRFFVTGAADARVRQAAIDALSERPGGAALLTQVAHDEGAPPGAREAVIATLAVGGEPSAPHTLWALHRQGVDTPLGRHARSLLERHHAQFLGLRLAESPTVRGRDGAYWLAGGMALHGAFFMTALAEVAGGSPGGSSVLGGAAVGGAAPYLLTLNDPPSIETATWLNSTTTLGLAGGALLGGVVDGSTETGLLLALGGQSAGLALGLLTDEQRRLSQGDILYLDFAGTLGSLAGLGSTLLISPDASSVSGAAAALGGLAAGVVTGYHVAPRLVLSRADSFGIMLATSLGMWVGAVAPRMLSDDPSDEALVGGQLVGGGVGFGVGTWLSQVTEPSKDEVLGIAGGFTLGSAVGGGLSMLLDPGVGGDRLWAGMVLGGGALGGVAALAGGGEEQTRGEQYSTGLGLGWGLWHGAALIEYFQADEPAEGAQTSPGEWEERDTRHSGALWLGLGVGGFAGATAGRLLKPEPLEVLVASTGGAWGSWIGGWGAHVLRKHGADLDADDLLLSALIGSDVGLLGSVLLLTPQMGLSARQLGWIEGGGLLGMGVGTSVAVVFSDHVAEGNMIGTLAGLVAGALSASWMDLGGDDATRGAAASGPRATDVVWLAPLVMVVPEVDGSVSPRLTLGGLF